MSAERAASFWQQAQYATARADKARSDEMRRAWLIIARDWANMAGREETKVALQGLAYVAQSIPMAPEAVETHPDDAEPNPADLTAANQSTTT